LELIEKGGKFSLVILDLRMPNLDGIEVLKRIKKIDSVLPVIILTAVATHQTVVDVLKFGAVNFIAKPVDIYRVKEVVKKALLQGKGQSLGFGTVRELVSADELLKESFAEAIKVLTEIIEIRNPSLAAHSRWTAKYAVAIAERMGFSKEEIEVIRQTSLLHDIGKVGLSDEILFKKEEDLTPEQKEQLKQHPQMGERMLKHFKLMNIEQTIIRYHHECFDGSGYPDGLKGEEIPVYARIVTVSDAFEALTSAKSGKEPLSQKEAINKLRQESNTQFDSKIVEVLGEIIQD
ncbi:MAG: HD domain-containing phosphohydrolase, partial [Candidatus Omnitrophota bacterium]